MSATVLQNDTLIARSAYTHDCFVVTENVKDFSLLQKVMPKLEVIPAADFSVKIRVSCTLRNDHKACPSVQTGKPFPFVKH